MVVFSLYHCANMGGNPLGEFLPSQTQDPVDDDDRKGREKLLKLQTMFRIVTTNDKEQMSKNPVIYYLYIVL